jgi:hypothetical protein
MNYARAVLVHVLCASFLEKASPLEPFHTNAIFTCLFLSVECPYFVAADVLSALTLNYPPPQIIACFQKSDLWKHVVHKL